MHLFTNITEIQLAKFLNDVEVSQQIPATLAWTTSAAAVDALHDLPFFKLRLRDAADAHRAEVGVTGLNTTQATKVLVPLWKNESYILPLHGYK